ncbi:phage tail protein [Marinicauda algicola]|uniref:Phage tail protein n=1 Tax=Marinicauda algicola TaxID=2029849 RepID=A0A4S2GYP4_9PROT|nr:tail fiber protein [Marinicauda algicola]TGY87902.1 phage tail protein [Marinicauda algicola]
MRAILNAALAAGSIAAAATGIARADADPYIGEIMMVGFDFCPQGWQAADGSTLSIASNTALFSLIGTQFGGNGTTTFNVPDLRGRVPLGIGQGPGLTPRTQGEAGGTETVTLTVNQLPAHNHVMQATSSPPDTNLPDGAAFGTYPAGQAIYDDGGGALDHQFRPDMLSVTGQGQPVPNMMPFQTIRYCIALVGIFPPRP